MTEYLVSCKIVNKQRIGLGQNTWFKVYVLLIRKFMAIYMYMHSIYS